MTDKTVLSGNGDGDGDFERGGYVFDGALEDFFTEGTDEATEKTEAKAAGDKPEEKQDAAETQENAKDAPPTEKKGEKDSAPPAASETTDNTENVPVQALKAERDKRQEIERQLEDLRKEVRSLKGESKEEAATSNVSADVIPDMYEDPENYKKWLTEQVRNESRQSSFEERVNATQAALREKHSDYDDTVEVFKELAEKNPDLGQELFNHHNPAEFAYNTAKNYLESKRLSSPETRKELEDKMRAEIKAELESERNAEKAARSQDLTRQAIETPDVLKLGSGSVSAAIGSTRVEDYISA